MGAGPRRATVGGGAGGGGGWGVPAPSAGPGAPRPLRPRPGRPQLPAVRVNSPRSPTPGARSQTGRVGPSLPTSDPVHVGRHVRPPARGARAEPRPPPPPQPRPPPPPPPRHGGEGREGPRGGGSEGEGTPRGGGRFPPPATGQQGRVGRAGPGEVAAGPAGTWGGRRLGGPCWKWRTPRARVVAEAEACTGKCGPGAIG